MARDLPTIQAALNDAQAAQPALAPLNSPSQTAIYTLWKYIIALCQLLLEQLIDLKISAIESVVASAPVGSLSWLQQKVYEFQYDAITPQLLDIVNFAPSYNPVDLTKRIISQASVRTAPNNTVNVLVATGNPPAALSGPQLAALNSYLTLGGNGTYSGRSRGIGFAGINYLAASYSPDYLYIRGTIYYNGQYAAIIQVSVIAAITNYLFELSTIDFNGSVTLLSLTDAIQAVPGVDDVLLVDVAIRANTVAFGSKTFMVQSQHTIITTYPTFAGYIIPEIAPNDLATVLTFTAV